jgi:site-specific DNA recombinase
MNRATLRAAIYARVSSEQQAKNDTIASQLDALRGRLRQDGLVLDPELSFVDDGFSGGSLLRPALERLRDLAAAGALDRLYVQAPDRLARKYAYQVLLVDELRRCGLEIVFLDHPPGRTPEDELLVQVQGMVAEYERAKILERSRRGKRHAARSGSVSVLTNAPYGYRYVAKNEGGGRARYEVVPEESRIVERIFAWAGLERCPLAEIGRRLRREGVRTRTGREVWSRTTIWNMLRNPAYKGQACFGKPGVAPDRRQLRPARGRPEHPRRRRPLDDPAAGDPISIPVPAIIGEDLFAAVQEQLEENRMRGRAGQRGARHLLQGLLVCGQCGYALCGKECRCRSAGGAERAYCYYRCSGTEPHRFGGERVCQGKQVRSDRLEAAVWEDIRSLLSDPGRLRDEYERRLRREAQGGVREARPLADLIRKARSGVSRLIDAFGDGLLERGEFEPRLSKARERLARLEEEERLALGRGEEEESVRLVIGQLEGFARRVEEGLLESDWASRREVIRALVKRVEVGDEEVRVVYKVSPLPFSDGPARGISPDCMRRVGAPAGVRPGAWGDGEGELAARSDAEAAELPGRPADVGGVPRRVGKCREGGSGRAGRGGAGGDRVSSGGGPARPGRAPSGEATAQGLSADAGAAEGRPKAFDASRLKAASAPFTLNRGWCEG